jgi:hypothetical protein
MTCLPAFLPEGIVKIRNKFLPVLSIVLEADPYRKVKMVVYNFMDLLVPVLGHVPIGIIGIIRLACHLKILAFFETFEL